MSFYSTLNTFELGKKIDTTLLEIRNFELRRKFISMWPQVCEDTIPS